MYTHFLLKPLLVVDHGPFLKNGQDSFLPSRVTDKRVESYIENTPQPSVISSVASSRLCFFGMLFSSEELITGMQHPMPRNVYLTLRLWA